MRTDCASGCNQRSRKSLKSAFLLSLTLLLNLSLAVWPGAALAESKDPTFISIRGTVLGPLGAPVKGAEVELWTKSGELSLSDKVDKRGKFLFKHEPSETCYLEVSPPHGSGLASAIIEDVSGSENRSLIVNLKHGFQVSGNVRSDEEGLKNILVKVFSEEHETDSAARVHGGGAVKTGRSGHFELVLTPGPKHLIVLNDRYTRLENRFDAKFTVTSDMQLQDIVLHRADAQN